MFDEYMGMPEKPWLPVSSFQVPAVPPLLGPAAGTLVQLPCVNADWLPLILGALDQLRNPTAWPSSLTDSALNDILNQTDELRDMFAVINVPCCNVQLRLTASCVLQYSVDGGSTWIDTTDWSTNFGNCVQLAFPGPVPPNPGGKTPSDRACDIALYLSKEIIQDVVAKAVQGYNTSLTQLEFGLLIFDTIAFAFPITAIAADVFAAFYIEVTGGTIADFTTASTDPVLVTDLTCAIWSAIKTTGYITASNLAAVITNVCAIPYFSAAVVTAICNFMTNIGLANLRAMQNVGALALGDCSGCSSSWCRFFDWSTGSALTWGINAGQGSGPFAGVGFLGNHGGGAGSGLQVAGPTFSGTPFVTRMRLTGNKHGIDDPSVDNGIYENGGALLAELVIPTGAFDVTVDLNTTVHQLNIVIYSSTGTGGDELSGAYVEGTGTDPFIAGAICVPF